MNAGIIHGIYNVDWREPGHPFLEKFSVWAKLIHIITPDNSIHLQSFKGAISWLATNHVYNLSARYSCARVMQVQIHRAIIP